jgi:oxygen-dependent protoporphyrinogen oxidase
MAGLTAAYKRAREGAETIVLERSQSPGGVVRTVRRDGFLLEAGPNTVRSTPELAVLVEELGLAPEMLVASARLPRYVDYRGRLHAVPMSPAALLTTPLLSLRAKGRMLAEPFQPGAASEEESVRDFFARRLGPEVADRLVAPFISGIFAGDATRVSAEAAFPSLARWDRAHGSLLRGAIRERRAAAPAKRKVAPRGLLSFRDGLVTLPRALARYLGDAFRPGTGAVAVIPGDGGWTVRGPAGEMFADELILAAPAAGAAELVRPFDPETADVLAGIPHPPLAVLHLAWPLSALPRPLEGFGHLVVPDPSRRILGAVWSSSLFPGRAPAGEALLTVFLGGARDPEAPSLSDEALVSAAASDLQSEGLVRGEPRLVMLTRWERAIPQYERGHLRRMDALSRAEARWPGLKFLGNYRGGIAVGDVVRSALAV